MKEGGQKDFLSKRTKKGLLLLVVLCLGILYTPRFLNYMFPPEQESWTSKEIKALESLRRHQVEKETSTVKVSSTRKSRYSRPPARFSPENYSKREWMALGLTEKQALTTMKFVSKGLDGPTALERIRVIPVALKKLIADSIVYKEKEVVPVVKENSEIEEVKEVELNSATAEDLERLPGIGPYFAEKIVDYRARLGGFHRVEQLLEIYRFDVEKLERIQDFVHVDLSKIRTLQLNLDPVDVLKQHPYINYNVANSIVKMRKQRGMYKSIDELLESALINKELLDKLKPYVSL